MPIAAPETLPHTGDIYALATPRHLALRITCWAVALTLGAIQAWTYRFTMTPDSISYLDIGDAYWRRDWHNAISAYWSPLYSWILAFFMNVLKPSIAWEYPVMHFVNFLIYLVALVTFSFLLENFIAAHARQALPSDSALQAVPRSVWYLLGYSLFVSSSLILIRVGLNTPDLCVAALIYLAFGLALKIRHSSSPHLFALLGIVLGLSYLAKSVMLPVGFLLLITVWAGTPGVRFRNVLIALGCFLLVALPFVAAISIHEQRLTLGDSGKITYQICVQHSGLFLPVGQNVNHPVTQLVDQPPVYSFAAWPHVTDAVWFNPSYWYSGVSIPFNLRLQLQELWLAVNQYGAILFTTFFQLNFTLALVIMLIVTGDVSAFFKDWLREWPLWMPGIAVMALYSLVWVEGRYVAAWITLLWLSLFSRLRLRTPESRILFARVGGGVWITTVVLSLVLIALLPTREERRRSQSDILAAANLHLKAGDKLAVIGIEPAGRSGAYVARLARLQIVAETRLARQFWNSDEQQRAKILEAFRRSGASTVLSSEQPYPPPAPWVRLGDSDYYLYKFGESR